MTQSTLKFLLLYKIEVKRILSVFLHTDEEKKDSLTSILVLLGWNPVYDRSNQHDFDVSLQSTTIQRKETLKTCYIYEKWTQTNTTADSINTKRGLKWS